MKKVFTLFLSLAMISSLSVGAYANENEDLPMNTFPMTEEIMTKINKEQPAIDAYEEINVGLGIVDPSHPAFPNYPDNFSGAYYADEKLHLCLTENSPQTQMEYAALVSDPSVLVFETANYSYNDLYPWISQDWRRILYRSRKSLRSTTISNAIIPAEKR